MRTVLQRVTSASVRTGDAVFRQIGKGYVLLVGIEQGDTAAEVDATARKIVDLRCFPGRTPMDLPLRAVDGACLVVSQLTLLAELASGNRPSFTRAAAPAHAEELYELLIARLRAAGLTVESGRFAAHMEVELVNDGPVTFVLEARQGRICE